MKRELIVVLLVSLFCLNFVSAITGSIGNARMILREVDEDAIKVGDTIEKYILVKNVNDVAIDVELFASGDLADDIRIITDKFSLEPGQDRKAYFQIKVTEEGTTESNINVRFTPVEGGNGVGLTSTIIIIASEGSGFWGGLFGGDDDADEDEIDVMTGAAVLDSGKKISPAFVVFFMMIVFLVLLVILLILMIRIKKTRGGKTKPKKRVKGKK